MQCSESIGKTKKRTNQANSTANHTQLPQAFNSLVHFEERRSVVCPSSLGWAFRQGIRAIEPRTLEDSRGAPFSPSSLPCRSHLRVSIFICRGFGRIA